MKTVSCYSCNREVYNDEIALNIKLFGKHIGVVYCYDCLSHRLSCEVTELIKLSDYYKNTGCTIFKTQFTREGEQHCIIK